MSRCGLVLAACVSSRCGLVIVACVLPANLSANPSCCGLDIAACVLPAGSSRRLLLRRGASLARMVAALAADRLALAAADRAGALFHRRGSFGFVRREVAEMLLVRRVAAQFHEQQIRLKVQRVSQAEQPEVEAVVDDDALATLMGSRDCDVRQRWGRLRVELDDRHHLGALRDVNRRRQSGHERELVPSHALVLVARHVPHALRFTNGVDPVRTGNLWVGPRLGLAVLVKELHVDDVGHKLEMCCVRRVFGFAHIALPADDRALAVFGQAVLLTVTVFHVLAQTNGSSEINRHFAAEMLRLRCINVEPRLLELDPPLVLHARRVQDDVVRNRQHEPLAEPRRLDERPRETVPVDAVVVQAEEPSVVKVGISPSLVARCKPPNDVTCVAMRLALCTLGSSDCRWRRAC